MEMTPNEILRSFQEAKDRHEQIRILADLNLCKPSKIIEILKQAGVDKRLLPRTNISTEPQGLKPRALHDWDRMLELAKTVRDAVANGAAPESVWIHEMSDTLIRYYPSSKTEGDARK